MRASAVGVCVGLLLAAPLAAAWLSGLAPGDWLGAATAGLVAAVAQVGWVFVPQLLLAVAIASLGVQQLACRAAGLAVDETPAWLDPAVESALLLGLLGTISGMVSGFVGLSPEELQPGPLVHSLGTALRSSFVGFLIALVGVWVKARTAAAPPAGELAAA